MSISEAFEKKGKVEVYGWVHDSRDLSKVRFIVLRDISGRIQVTGVKSETSPKVFDLMDKITRESVIRVKGELKDSKQAPGGKEILPTEIEIVSEAQHPLPID